MATFKDSAGREWSPRITCLSIDWFEQETGIGILREAANAFRAANLTAADIAAIASLQSGKGDAGVAAEAAGKIVGFLADLFGGKVGNVVKFAWTSVRRQADERKISYEDFAEALDVGAAAPVLKEEFDRFFRSLSQGQAKP